jgi:hypothetical protein
LPERVGSGDGDRPGSGDGPAGPEDEVGTGVGDGDGPGVGPTGPGNEAETGVGERGRKTPLLGAGVGAGAAGVGAGPGQAPRRGRPSRVTWVSREVELLAGSGSGWLPVTVAESLTQAGSSGAVTSTVTTAELPGARDPRLQATVPSEFVQLPFEALVEENCT